MRLALTVIGVTQTNSVPLMVFAKDERGAIWCWHAKKDRGGKPGCWFQWTHDDDFMPPLFVDVPESR